MIIFSGPALSETYRHQVMSLLFSAFMAITVKVSFWWKFNIWFWSGSRCNWKALTFRALNLKGDLREFRDTDYISDTWVSSWKLQYNRKRFFPLFFLLQIFPLLVPLLLPVTQICLTGSLYTILAVAIERFLAVTRLVILCLCICVSAYLCICLTGSLLWLSIDSWLILFLMSNIALKNNRN